MPKNRAIPAIAVSLLIPLAALAQQPPGNAPIQGPLPAAGAGQGGFNFPAAGGPAAAKKEEKEAPPTDAEKTIDEAIAKLKKASAFSAEIAQSVDMLGQKFEIKGTYLRAGENRVYLKLTVSGLGDASATTLQACDGTTLWDFRQVLDTQTYIKYSVGPLFKKLADPAIDPAQREQLVTRMGLAGPEVLLSGLRKKVGFNQKAEETLEGKKVWVVRGDWKDRTGLVGPNQQPLPPTMPLPPYMPSNVAAWIGQDDGFPYKVEMYGNVPSMLQADSRRIGPDGRPIGNKTASTKVEPSRIVLRYLDVKVNPTIKPELFGWQPPADAKGVVDGTEPFLADLEQLIAYQTAQKKAEAAKSAETVLPETIPVPKAGAPPADLGLPK